MDVTVECPYCGERLELYVDESGGAAQHYVEDCQVCCRPMNIVVELGDDEECVVSADRADD